MENYTFPNHFFRLYDKFDLGTTKYRMTISYWNIYIFSREPHVLCEFRLS